MTNNYTLVGERNYAAESVFIDESQITYFDELDNLVGYPWAGYTVLIPHSMISSYAVVFPAECQLSEFVAQDNNLYAKQEMNSDPTIKGYLGKNRRVKAIKLRGVNSNALALPAAFFGYPPVGTVFDTQNGHEICRKYVIPHKEQTNAGNKYKKLWRRVDDKFLPEHYDTGQFWRESDKFNANDHVVITQKLHGSSCRLSHTYVKRKLRWRDKVARWFGIESKEFDFDYIGGSRKVIKDPNNPALQQEHYYSSDIWSEAALKYGPLLPKGVVVYGELIGYVTGTSTPIQAGYTYNVPVGETELYVYRVAVVQEDGGLYDLSWPGVKEFCKERGLKWVPELWSGEARYVVPDRWTNRNFNENPEPGFSDTPVPLCNESPCDEGVVVRRDGVIPFALKIKSPNFLIHETKQLDKAEKTGEEIME